MTVNPFASKILFTEASICVSGISPLSTVCFHHLDHAVYLIRIVVKIKDYIIPTLNTPTYISSTVR